MPSPWHLLSSWHFSSIPSVAVYTDVILITGEYETAHLRRSPKPSRIMNQEDQMPVYGYLPWVCHRCWWTPPTSWWAIHWAPTPKNITELKSYLELLMYYGKFLPNLSTPLYKLLRRQVWKWSSERDKTSKEFLTSSQLLVHFDPKLLLLFACDALSYGTCTRDALMAQRSLSAMCPALWTQQIIILSLRKRVSPAFSASNVSIHSIFVHSHYRSQAIVEATGWSEVYFPSCVCQDPSLVFVFVNVWIYYEIQEHWCSCQRGCIEPLTFACWASRVSITSKARVADRSPICLTCHSSSDPWPNLKGSSACSSCSVCTARLAFCLSRPWQAYPIFWKGSQFKGVVCYGVLMLWFLLPVKKLCYMRGWRVWHECMFSGQIFQRTLKHCLCSPCQLHQSTPLDALLHPGVGLLGLGPDCTSITQVQCKVTWSWS